jgi:hypothetical protein
MGPMSPMGHHTAPQAHATAALAIIDTMRPIPWGPFRHIGKSPRTPWSPWASFERAPWVTWDSSRWVSWGAIGAHGAHPMGPMGPMGRPRILEHNTNNPTGACRSKTTWQLREHREARGHHGHHGPHLKGRHGPHGTHPHGSHGVQSGPIGLTRRAPWVPRATALTHKPMQ